MLHCILTDICLSTPGSHHNISGLPHPIRLLTKSQFAQELLSTFSTSLGEVALQPSTGGTFKVHLYDASPAGSEDGTVDIKEYLLWDRKTEGGFPGKSYLSTSHRFLSNLLRLL